jgi:hypothetical protein
MLNNSVFALAATLSLVATTASGCIFACRPGEKDARAVLENLIARRFNAPFDLVSYETRRTADFDLIVGEIRGYEIFFKATVRFPRGANLDCAPGIAQRPADCSDDPYFSVIRPTRPDPDGRQYIEPNGARVFDEDLRFAELQGGWKGPDGQLYKP